MRWPPSTKKLPRPRRLQNLPEVDARAQGNCLQAPFHGAAKSQLQSQCTECAAPAGQFEANSRATCLYVRGLHTCDSRGRKTNPCALIRNPNSENSAFISSPPPPEVRNSVFPPPAFAASLRNGVTARARRITRGIASPDLPVPQRQKKSNSGRDALPNQHTRQNDDAAPADYGGNISSELNRVNVAVHSVQGGPNY
jgi:hypothetical protein